MAERSADESSLVVTSSQPLIGVILREHGQDVVRYFVGEDAADAALAANAPDAALRLAGAWNDLDWREVADALDRIRHDSPPSPPISP